MASSRSTHNPIRPRHLLAVFGVLAVALIAVIGGSRSLASADPPTAPGNDLLANFRIIAGTSGTIANRIDGATREPLEPLVAGQNTVWFKWTAPFSGSTSFNTEGSFCYHAAWNE